MKIRIGSAFDIHRLEEGIPLIIGGIEIPYHKGSKGHSDGDVLIHVICDAILGALNEGDLGKHFPSSDDSLKGISSSEILVRVMDKMTLRNARIINIDSTIILQEPRMSPHLQAMKEFLSPRLNITSDQLSIKSKTSDHIGQVGENKAIAAKCSLLIEIQ